MESGPGAVKDETFVRTVAGLGKILDAVTPWLLDLGSWIFGALTAFNLVILGALLTVGPVDQAVLIATAAFALAFPADVAGFVVLRLAADMKEVALEALATTAFREVGFTFEAGASSDESRERRRLRTALTYSYSLLTVALTLTLVGMTAALWHMAWWIAPLFVVMVVVSLVLISGAIASTGSPGIWRPPHDAVEPRKSTPNRTDSHPPH
jgi:hypothetical protein